MDTTFTHEVALRSGSLLVSSSYLQNLLEPGSTVTGLQAVIEGEIDQYHVALMEKWDTEGRSYFLIDDSLSLCYKLLFHLDKTKPVETCDFVQGCADKCIEIEGSSEEIEPPMISIVPWIRKQLGAHRLHKFLDICGTPLQVQELPLTYNGNKIFELPATFGKKKENGGDGAAL